MKLHVVNWSICSQLAGKLGRRLTRTVPQRATHAMFKISNILYKSRSLPRAAERDVVRWI